MRSNLSTSPSPKSGKSSLAAPNSRLKEKRKRLLGSGAIVPTPAARQSHSAIDLGLGTALRVNPLHGTPAVGPVGILAVHPGTVHSAKGIAENPLAGKQVVGIGHDGERGQGLERRGHTGRIRIDDGLLHLVVSWNGLSGWPTVHAGKLTPTRRNPSRAGGLPDHVTCKEVGVGIDIGGKEPTLESNRAKRGGRRDIDHRLSRSCLVSPAARWSHW